jgi:hypothetical protein
MKYVTNYVVKFKGTGWTAPTPENPKGLKVTGEGTITVPGPAPKTNFDIPWSVLDEAKRVLMEQCHLVKMDGDTDIRKNGPTLWLVRPERQRNEQH